MFETPYLIVLKICFSFELKLYSKALIRLRLENLRDEVNFLNMQKLDLYY